MIDQFHDTAFGVLVRQLTAAPELEAFVKGAEFDPVEAETLPDGAFAWPAERRFPIHTPEHAALSNAYVKYAADAGVKVPKEVNAKISEACRMYGVPAKALAVPSMKVASGPPVEPVLPRFNYLPVPTSPRAEDAPRLKKAQAQLLEDITKLPLEERKQAAAILSEKLAAVGVKAATALAQLTGRTVSSTKEAADWTEARAGLLPDGSPEGRAYAGLAKGLRALPPHAVDTAGLQKVADVIAKLDADTGLVKHYDRRLPDAMRTVFNTDKLAEEVVDVDGCACSISKLKSLPKSFWEDLGGKDLARDIEESPESLVDIVKTLPLDLKAQLKVYAK